MVDQLALQAVLTYLTLISIPVGVIYHIMTLRNTRKNQQLQLETRQAQLFMQIYDRFNETEFSAQWNKVLFHWEWEDFEEWWQKYSPEANIEENASFVSVTRYYEGVGVLVKKGLIDLNLVGELMSSYIIRFWEQMEPAIKGVRERLNWPEVFQGFEYLYHEIKKYEQQHPKLKT